MQLPRRRVLELEHEAIRSLLVDLPPPLEGTRWLQMRDDVRAVFAVEEIEALLAGQGLPSLELRRIAQQLLRIAPQIPPSRMHQPRVAPVQLGEKVAHVDLGEKGPQLSRGHRRRMASFPTRLRAASPRRWPRGAPITRSSASSSSLGMSS